MRPSKRAPDELRAVTFERNVTRYAEGSCLVKFGNTHVLCTASLEDKPPQWLRGQGRGWVTAEYAMLPRATHTRTRRESSKEIPIKDHVAAISCGVSKGVAVLDLDYDEDSVAETDANFVMTGAGGLVEVQATAEGAIFTQDQLDSMLGLARKGIADLVALQKAAINS